MYNLVFHTNQRKFPGPSQLPVISLPFEPLILRTVLSGRRGGDGGLGGLGGDGGGFGDRNHIFHANQQESWARQGAIPAYSLARDHPVRGEVFGEIGWGTLNYSNFDLLTRVL